MVVDCLLPSGKRVMLDPAWRLYLKDQDGEYVSLPCRRELLLADEPFFANSTADYNGMGVDKAYYRDYMMKNTFRFARCALHKDGVDRCTENSRYIELIPLDYSIEHFPDNRKADFIDNNLAFW